MAPVGLGLAVLASAALVRPAGLPLRSHGACTGRPPLVATTPRYRAPPPVGWPAEADEPTPTPAEPADAPDDAKEADASEAAAKEPLDGPLGPMPALLPALVFALIRNGRALPTALMSAWRSGGVAALARSAPLAMGIRMRAILALALAPLLPGVIRRTLRSAHALAQKMRVPAPIGDAAPSDDAAAAGGADAAAASADPKAGDAPRPEGAAETYAYDDSVLQAPEQPLQFLLWALGPLWLLRWLSSSPAAASIPALRDVAAASTGAAAGRYVALALRLALAWTSLNLVAKLERRYGTSDAQREAATSVMGLGSSATFTMKNSPMVSLQQARANAIAKTASILIWIGGGLAALSSLGVNVQAVLAVSGAGGVVLGLAGREMLANYIGGVTIYLSQPFAVGDWIHDTERSLDGWVEHIGWYYTKVNTWDKRPMYIPNAKFYTMTVTNASRMTNRRILQTLRLRLRDISKLPEIVAEVRSAILSRDDLDPRQHRLVFFREVGEYSVDIWLSCFTRSVFLTDYLSTQQEILFEVDQIVRRHGARFATSLQREQIMVGADAPVASAPPTMLPSRVSPADEPAWSAAGGVGPGSSPGADAKYAPLEAPPSGAHTADAGVPSGFTSADDLDGSAVGELDAEIAELRARAAAAAEKEAALEAQAAALDAREVAIACMEAATAEAAAAVAAAAVGEEEEVQDMVQAAVASAAAKQAVSDANQAVIDLAEAAGQTPAAPAPVSSDAAADEAEMAAPPADDGSVAEDADPGSEDDTVYIEEYERTQMGD